MISSIRHRIEKLEAADTRLVHRIIWEDGTGSADREIARLEASGELDDKDVVLHITHWRSAEATTAVNKLMHSRAEMRSRAAGYGATE
jgi:hypothetical protein